MSHCGRGDEYIVGQMAHTYRWEGGGAAVLGSVQPQPLEHAGRRHARARRHRGGDQARRRALRAEPAALPREHDRRQGAAARLPRGGVRAGAQRGLATHLDGARLFNAAVALGGDPRATARAIAAPFDSVSVCFSKGLGAPVGSALVGSREFIDRRAPLCARCSAAACARPACSRPRRSHALDHHVERLADDHALARAPRRRPRGARPASTHLHRWARRSARRSSARARSSPERTAGARWSAAACARPARRRGGVACARPPRRPPRRRSRAGDPPRRRAARPARAHGRAAADQHRLRRPDRRARRRPDPAPEVARRARHRACIACASSPTSTSMPKASTAPSPAMREYLY